MCRSRRARQHHRLPRPERRRQVDHAAEAHRAHPADLRHRDHHRQAVRRPAEPRPGPGHYAGRRRAAPRPYRPRDAAAERACSVSRRAGSTRCSRPSGSPPAKRRVGQYSLGMRQRLGIASALLGDPAVLILDEPANGMDPEGIRWMRGLLQDFASRGGTVILSSHLLGEVKQTVDRLVVIGGGRIVANGPLGGTAGPETGPRPRSRPDRTRPGPEPPPACSSSPLPRTARCAVRDATAEQVGRGRRGRRPDPDRTAPERRRPAWRTCSSSSPPRHDHDRSPVRLARKAPRHDHHRLASAVVPAAGTIAVRPDRRFAALTGIEIRKSAVHPLRARRWPLVAVLLGPLGGPAGHA